MQDSFRTTFFGLQLSTAEWGADESYNRTASSDKKMRWPLRQLPHRFAITTSSHNPSPYLTEMMRLRGGWRDFHNRSVRKQFLLSRREQMTDLFYAHFRGGSSLSGCPSD
jgi:hypothetical protein